MEPFFLSMLAIQVSMTQNRRPQGSKNLWCV